MSDSQKSFFAGLSGALTGIAGVLTAIVGVVGLSINQGWIGGTKHASSTVAPTNTGTSTQTTVSGQPGVGGSTAFGSPSTSVAVAQFTANPTSLGFQAVGPRDAALKVSNTGVVPFTVLATTVTGPNADRFSVDTSGCSGSVDPGRSCDLKVTFSPKPGTFSATLVVQVSGAPRAVEIPIQATAIL